MAVTDPQITIVLPARDEAALIAEAVRRVAAALDAIGRPYEIVVGDSASSDDTGARALATPVPGVRVVRCELPGKGRVLSAAMAEARGDYVGFIDSDLEIDPSYIAAHVAALDDGADAAIATKTTPDARRSRTIRRRFATDVYNRLVSWLLGTPYSDHQAGLKLFRRDAILDALSHVSSDGWAWDTEVLVHLHRSGRRVAEVPVVPIRTRENRLGIARVSFELLRGIGGVLRRQGSASPEGAVAAIGVWSTATLLALALLLFFRPALLLTNTTPAGYDLAGHVYPMSIAVHDLIPRLRIHGWDSGWFGGFPVYWFYFPLPALLVAALAPLAGFLPAVKIVSVIGTVALPLALAWLAREARLRLLTGVAATLVGASFLLIGSYSFYGANLESTLVGEFAYALGFTLALAYVASLMRACRTGGGFALPAMLLAATALAHIVPTIAAVLASLPLLHERTTRRNVIASWGVGFLLAAFWAVPFLLRLEPVDLYAATPSQLSAALPRELLPLLPLAAAGAWYAWRHARMLLGLAIPAVLGFILYWIPLGPVHQGRLLPVFFMYVHLLAGVAVGAVLTDVVDTLRARRGRWVGRAAIVAGAIALALAPFALRGQRDLPGWASFNYAGIEARPEWPELDSLLAALRAQPPGRVYWNDAPGDFATLGSRHLFALLPYWAPEHDALRGLWVESSQLTPTIDTIDVVIRATHNADAATSRAAWQRALGMLGALHVEYFIATGTTAKSGVGAALSAAPLYDGGRFALFRLPAAPLVESTAGPTAVRAARAAGTTITFETRAPGTPHIVRGPWFANWRAEGAVGPVRVEPGFMGVVPTGEHVVLRFRTTWVERVGTLLSLAGALVITASAVIMRARRAGAGAGTDSGAGSG